MEDIARTSSVAPLTVATTQPRRLEARKIISLNSIRLSVRDRFTKDLSDLSVYYGSINLEPIPAQLHGMFLFGRYKHQMQAIPFRPQLTCGLVEKSRESESSTPSVISLDESFSEEDNVSQISSDTTDELDNISFTSDDDPFVDALTSPEVENFVIPEPPKDETRLLKVFPNILSFVVSQPDGYLTLYNASLVCKALSTLALDALWRELPHLSPIYDLLPTERTDDGWEYDLWNPDFDWTPFHAYTRRVKRFSFTHWPGQLSPEILYSLEKIHPEPLLPNLQSVDVTVVEDHSPLELLYFLKFIPPTVSRMTVKGVPGPSARGHSAAITLLRVMGKTPSYCTDAFTDLNITAAFSPSLWQQLLHFKNLKNLSITVTDGDVPIELIQRLGSLPSLSTLELSFESIASTSGPVNDAPPLETDFGHLEVVRLSGCSTDVGAVVHLLGSCKNLKNLSIAVVEGQIPIKLIQQLGSLPSLSILELSLGPLAGTSDRYPVNDAQPRENDFKQLEVVRLSGCSADVAAIVLVFGGKLGRPIHTMDLTYTQGTAPANEDRPFIMSLFPNMRQLTIRAVPGLVSNTPLTGSSLHGSEEGIIQESNGVACHSPQAHQVPSIRLDGDLWREFTPLDIERIEFFGIQVLTRCADIARIFETRSGFNNLHTLRLTCFSAEETLTLKTLAMFSSKLPQLKSLSLYVDLDGHDEDELQLQIDESDNLPEHGLKSLFINNANEMLSAGYKDMFLVGEFLHSMFPSLKKVGIFKPRDLGVSGAGHSDSMALVVNEQRKPVSEDWWMGVFKGIRRFQKTKSKTQPELVWT